MTDPEVASCRARLPNNVHPPIMSPSQARQESTKRFRGRVTGAGCQPAAWRGVNPKASLSSRLKLPDLKSKSRASELLYAAASCRALHHYIPHRNPLRQVLYESSKQASPLTARTIRGDQTLGLAKFAQKNGVRMLKSPQYTTRGKKLSKKSPKLFFMSFFFMRYSGTTEVRGGAKMTEGTRTLGQK